ncbi:MAG: hypothetical protein ACR2GY_12225 [Phycisphaerales bacterium]
MNHDFSSSSSIGNTLRRAALCACVVAAASTALCLHAPAFAQDGAASTVSSQPYLGYVTGDDVYIRCGAGTTYYPFGKLTKGHVIVVAEERFGWARVRTVGEAFDDLFGLVKSDEVRLNPDGKTAMTLGRVQVLAPNYERRNDPESSWKWVERVEPEQVLTILGEVQGASASYYMVALPETGEGWVSLNFIRKATDAEIAAARERAAARTAPAQQQTPQSQSNAANTPTTTTPPPQNIEPLPPVEVQPLQPVNPPAPTTTTTETVDADTVEVPNPLDTVGDDTLLDNAVDDDATGADLDTILDQPGGRSPSGTNPISPDRNVPAGNSMPGNIATPAWDNDILQPNDVTTISPRDVAVAQDAVATDDIVDPTDVTLADLEAAYETLKREPLRQAEIEPLRARYAALTSQQNVSERERAIASARVQLLDARLDLQTQMLEIDAVKARIDQAAENTESARIVIDRARQYTAVGVVSASTVYDGRRLPQLLRLADPSTGRTLAYLDPTASDIELARMMGQLVGVVGSKQFNDAMKLTIIAPGRIDVLSGSGPE